MNHCNRDENAEAIAPLEEAIALFAGLGDDLWRIDALTWFGWAWLMLDDMPAARDAFEQAKKLALSLGDPVTIAFVESKLGALDDAEGRPADALRRHLDAFANFDAAGNIGGLGFCLSRAGLSSYVLGDYRSALDFAMAGYEAFRDMGHGWGSSIAAERVAFAYLGLGQTAMARDWAMRSLRQVSHGAYARLGQLSALAAVAASYIREGQIAEWLPILRAVVADPDVADLMCS
jgi:tetratricopeptide (TPR) repeat protein